MFSISSPIVPAIIPKDESELKSLASEMYFAPEIHVDVVDGKFVESISWPFEPSGNPASLYTDLAQFSLEVDLMVEEPLKAASKWLEAGADMLVFHIETISVSELSTFRDVTNVSIGISCLNDTPLEDLEPYLPLADYVQLMGIAKIGSQGQTFDERLFARMEAVRKLAPSLPQSIDGSMNKETIVKVRRAGADRLIVGSGIMAAEDKEVAYKDLTKLAEV